MREFMTTYRCGSHSPPIHSMNSLWREELRCRPRLRPMPMGHSEVRKLIVDNNLIEGALKRAVLHRQNALFDRTPNGAQVGDLFMSLIHTCQLCGVNSFDYLVERQRHARELAACPTEWMPWNYRETLARILLLPD